MSNLKRSIAMIVACLFLATPCMAAENAIQTIFQDAFYGGLTGGLVGAAVMAFTKKPADHFADIGYGAAAGVLVGATYGGIVATRSFAEVEDGKVKFALPTIRPEFREANSKGQIAFVTTAELIRGRF